MMQRAVKRGLLGRKTLPLKHLGVDKTSFKKRHAHVTVIADLKIGHVPHGKMGEPRPT